MLHASEICASEGKREFKSWGHMEILEIILLHELPITYGKRPHPTHTINVEIDLKLIMELILK